MGQSLLYGLLPDLGMISFFAMSVSFLSMPTKYKQHIKHPSNILARAKKNYLDLGFLEAAPLLLVEAEIEAEAAEDSDFGSAS